MSVKIGSKSFKFKKNALLYYKNILNSYDFGISLTDGHYDDVIDLIQYDYQNYLAACTEPLTETKEESIDIGMTLPLFEVEEDYTIVDVKIGHAQFNTKCFEVCYANAPNAFISYIGIIRNKSVSLETLFLKSCRNIIQQDLLEVKQHFFDKFSVKGQVKCQESNLLSYWEELVVDHRQPNTLSMIVERFKELNSIDLDTLDFFQNYKNHLLFTDVILQQKFREYHKEKAALRIVRKELNLSRAHLARVRKSSKDLEIN
jgi:gluconate kinase